MKVMLYHILILVFLVLTVDCDEPEAISLEVDSEILKEMERYQIPSVVACVVKGKEIVWEGTYGHSNSEIGTPATRNTLYAMQSVSKLVLAVSVMQLWENGLIDLDTDINDYLEFDVRNPNFPDQKITPHMLLTHSSGLTWPYDEDLIPEFHHFFGAGEVPAIGNWLPQYIIPGGTHYRPSVWKFRPGEKEQYSNIGTSLLALIVENIAGEDYREYCKNNILEPLEMINSTFRLTEANADLLATPYYNSGHPMHPFVLRHYPAGSLYSNMEDFSHFMTAFLNNGEFNGKRILKKNTVDKMFEIQNPASGAAYLWWHCLGDCMGHEGGGTGFRSKAEWYHKAGKGIIILSNRDVKSVSSGRIYELVRYQSTKY